MPKLWGLSNEFGECGAVTEQGLFHSIHREVKSMVHIKIREEYPGNNWSIEVFSIEGYPMHYIECDDIKVMESIIKPYLKGEV
jgi:hypothetical protein